MARWPLRAKLVVAIGVALLPVLGLSGWRAYDDVLKARSQRAVAVAAAAELAVTRHRELIDSSRRLLTAACSEEAVQKSASPIATPDDVDRCESYLIRLLQKFPTEYSAAVVTDEAGVARCATVPSAVGTGLADRETFRQVRESKQFAIGASIASRLAPRTVIPVAVPILADGQFRGMCALGISLKAFTDLATPGQGAKQRTVMLVDRDGAPIGGSVEVASALPIAARITAAIAGNQTVFSDYGQNGSPYEFHVLPLAGNALFAVTSVPIAEGLSSLLHNWGEFALIALALIGALSITWLGADRWCARPLRDIQEFTVRVSRGEDAKLVLRPSWTPEVVVVGEGVRAMAEAIANREGALRAGLEQRDHMLREIHHRVKNNLQMISSLLNLQAGEIRSPRIRRFFGDAQNRVLTLSILHRHLYERSSWSLVDFQQFISDLVRQISVARSGGTGPAPRYQIRAPIMAVGPDTAIPVGLIVTEAVSSALSHDFSVVAAPLVRIEAAEKSGRQVELVIEDNGLDTNQGSIGPEVHGGFGLTLIRGLAMQLGGEVRVSAGQRGGTLVVVIFPMPEEEQADA